MAAEFVDLVGHIGIKVKAGIVGIVEKFIRLKAKIHKLGCGKGARGCIPVGETQTVADGSIKHTPVEVEEGLGEAGLMKAVTAHSSG